MISGVFLAIAAKLQFAIHSSTEVLRSPFSLVFKEFFLAAIAQAYF